MQARRPDSGFVACGMSLREGPDPVVGVQDRGCPPVEQVYDQYEGIACRFRITAPRQADSRGRFPTNPYRLCEAFMARLCRRNQRKWLMSFLETPKESPVKYLDHKFRQRENWKKGCIFHRIAEIKQPQPITEPSISRNSRQILRGAFHRRARQQIPLKKAVKSIGVTLHQSNAMTGHYARLCRRKWLMLFSLKFQRTNRQNALAIGSAKGKAGKKLYVDSAVAMKRAHAMTEPYAKIPRDGNATRDFVFGAFRTAS